MAAPRRELTMATVRPDVASGLVNSRTGRLSPGPQVDRRQPSAARHQPCRPLPAAPGRPSGAALSEVTVEEIQRAQALHPGGIGAVGAVAVDPGPARRRAAVLPATRHRVPAVLAPGARVPRRAVLCAGTWPSLGACGRSPSGSGLSGAGGAGVGRRPGRPRDLHSGARGPGRRRCPAHAARRPVLTRPRMAIVRDETPYLIGRRSGRMGVRWVAGPGSGAAPPAAGNRGEG